MDQSNHTRPQRHTIKRTQIQLTVFHASPLTHSSVWCDLLCVCLSPPCECLPQIKRQEKRGTEVRVGQRGDKGKLKWGQCDESNEWNQTRSLNDFCFSIQLLTRPYIHFYSNTSRLSAPLTWFFFLFFFNLVLLFAPTSTICRSREWCTASFTHTDHFFFSSCFSGRSCTKNPNLQALAQHTSVFRFVLRLEGWNSNDLFLEEENESIKN